MWKELGVLLLLYWCMWKELGVGFFQGRLPGGKSTRWRVGSCIRRGRWLGWSSLRLKRIETDDHDHVRARSQTFTFLSSSMHWFIFSHTKFHISWNTNMLYQRISLFFSWTQRAWTNLKRSTYISIYLCGVPSLLKGGRPCRGGPTTIRNSVANAMLVILNVGQIKRMTEHDWAKYAPEIVRVKQN